MENQSVIEEIDISTIRKKDYVPVIGNEYGRWTIISDKAFRYSNSNRITHWLVQCQCGFKGYRRADDLVRGKVSSCNSCSNLKKGKRMSKHYNYRGVGGISGTYLIAIRNGAKARNITFDVTKEYLWQLYLIQLKRCALSGIPIFFPETTRSLKTASLDRKDSSKGYIKGNVQWVHKHINIMKNNLSEIDFVNYCKLVIEKHYNIRIEKDGFTY